VHQNKIKEKFLFCEPLKETRKAVDTTAMAKEFCISKSISWDLTKAICTDGAVPMLVEYSGFKISVKYRNVNVISSHFILHQHALSLERLHPYLQDMLDVVVEAVSLTEERALNHCMFNMQCKEVWSHHTILLLHTEVLTRGLNFKI
jgi:hypothetical protein